MMGRERCRAGGWDETNRADERGRDGFFVFTDHLLPMVYPNNINTPWDFRRSTSEPHSVSNVQPLMKCDTSSVDKSGAPERCRKPQPSDRPSVEGVLRNLEVIPSSIPQDYGRQNPVSSTFFVSHLEYRAHA